MRSNTKCKKIGCYNAAVCHAGHCEDHCKALCESHKFQDYTYCPRPTRQPQEGRAYMGLELEVIANRKSGESRSDTRRRMVSVAGCVSPDSSINESVGVGGEIKLLLMSSHAPNCVADLLQRMQEYNGPFIVDRSCGYHIHLDIRGRRHRAIRVARAIAKEYEQWAEIVPPSRRENTYLYFGDDIESRYNFINCRTNTVEMRLHPGTVHPIKAKSWAIVCRDILKLIHNHAPIPSSITPTNSKVFKKEAREYLKARLEGGGVLRATSGRNITMVKNNMTDEERRTEHMNRRSAVLESHHLEVEGLNRYNDFTQLDELENVTRSQILSMYPPTKLCECRYCTDSRTRHYMSVHSDGLRIMNRTATQDPVIPDLFPSILPISVDHLMNRPRERAAVRLCWGARKQHHLEPLRVYVVRLCKERHVVLSKARIPYTKDDAICYQERKIWELKISFEDFTSEIRCWATTENVTLYRQSLYTIRRIKMIFAKQSYESRLVYDIRINKILDGMEIRGNDPEIRRRSQASQLTTTEKIRIGPSSI